MKTCVPLLLLSLALGVTATARAAVQETRDGSFAIQSVVLVEAKPLEAYRALVRISDWWDPAHTWSGSARHLTLEAKGGGCFCERLPNGGSVAHGRVVFAQPGQTLRVDGALGPLQEMPVTGVLTFAFAPDGAGTRVTMTYKVGGVLSMDAAKLAPMVDSVMSSQFERFKAHLARKNGR
jgi:hypothetical protein